MSKAVVDSVRQAITKRVTKAQIEQIERDWGLHRRSSVLDKLAKEKSPNVLKNIGAAIELLMEAGEDASSLEDIIKGQAAITQERQQLLYDRASTLTLLANIEQFFFDPNECERFVKSLSQDARDNLFSALLEVKEDER